MSKKLIQINTVCNGSVGNIMYRIQKAAKEAGYETLTFYGRRKGYTDLPSEKFGGFCGFWLHVIWTTITDRQGQFSYFYTRKMVQRLREEKPDIIHMHNLHGYYLNYPLLFQYLRHEFKGQIVWTFHDCWPITGHCPHFVIAKCDKWKEECEKCPNKGIYPTSWFLDSSKFNYRIKRKLFSEFDNMTIVCPSLWMAEQVKQSFLKDSKVKVVSNGIDLNMFYPRRNITIKDKYKLPIDKKIILGVASIWEERKGLKVFQNLAKVMSEEYRFVLVGLRKDQLPKMLPNMIGIQRIENQNELAELYSMADVFLNPSKEESFSLVTIEAMACGTPVIALDSSAVKELVNERNGILLHEPSMEEYVEAIKKCINEKVQVEGIRKTVRKYTLEHMTSEILQIYG